MAVHLHVHSNFSFGRGASTIADLCAAASRRGIRVMALTDLNGLYGAIPFVEAAGACGVKPIIGAEVDDGGGHRAILLAADRKGYGRLCAIITARRTRPSFSLPAALAGGREGMVVLTDHLPLLRFLLSEGGGRRDLYVEVPPRLEVYRAARSPSGFARGELAAFARRAGLPVAASHPVHFAHEGDWELACVLRGIFENSSYQRVLRERGEFFPSSWLLDAGALERGFEDLPGARRGALEIADRCGFVPETGRILLPRYPGARGPADSMRLLRARCADGLRRRCGPAPGQEVLRRLRYEIGMIESMSFADYFLIVSDIAAFARGRSIPMCGRGSAAGSLVSYALGMTDVDPVARSLSFERFLHTGRKDPPDVDIDFAWNRRDEVIDFVYGRFGRDRVAAISTHVTFAARGALREVARAMGIPDAQVSGVAKLIPWHMSARRIGEAGGSLLKQEPWKSVVRFAVRLDGFPKHLGIHVGGIVVSPGPLSDYLPAEVAPKGIVVTQWEMTGVEKAGLLKIDLLGNRSLSVIDDVLGDISRRGEERARALRSPFFAQGPAGRLELAGGDRLEADGSVRRLMRTGDSFGCFYVESPAMRGLLRKLRCDTFAGLVAASSVIRPGVSSSGMMRQYIERARGRPFRHLHPVMEKLLGETFGVMVYQEDVMRLAYHAGGLSWEEGNLMRKTMSGKRGGAPLERYREKFLAGAAARGIPPQIAAEIWRQMASFAGYSFCKAHSAAFAEVSMRALYLRAHYPAEFMAAVLSNHGGYYAAPAYTSECRRMGLELLRPSVNGSEVRFTGRGRRVRIGLGQIAKLRGEAAAATVEERRAGGRFLSLEDFLGRMKGRLEKDEVESMVMAGALDEFDAGGGRQRLLWESARLGACRRKAPVARQDCTFRVSGETVCGFSLGEQPPLAFAQRKDKKLSSDFLARSAKVSSADGGAEGGDAPLRSGCALPSFDCDDAARARMEIEALGFPVSCHVMDLVRPAIGKEAALRARQLPRLEGRRVTLAGTVITMKPVRTTRGDAMSFVSMEDETGTFEVTLFPAAYARARRLLAWSAGPYLVSGRVESDFGHFSLIGEEVRPIAAKIPASIQIPR